MHLDLGATKKLKSKFAKFSVIFFLVLACTFPNSKFTSFGHAEYPQKAAI